MTIITATTRLFRELRQQYNWKQEAADLPSWPSAEILELSDWLLDLWKTWLFSERAADTTNRLLWPAEERVIWEEIIRSQTDILPLDIPATAKAALKSWELLCSWNLSLDATEWKDSADSQAFYGWAREFHTRCREKGWFSNAELSSVVADLIERGEVSVPEKVEFAGFHERTPVQQRLIDVLARREVEIRDREHPDTVGDAVRIGLADAGREIRAAAEWARRILEDVSETAAPTFQIGIVVPGLEQRRGEIERVFGEVFHPRTRLQPNLDTTRLFNIGVGLPVDEYPIIQAAFLILRTDPQDIPIERAGQILRSPFLYGAKEEMTSRALLDVTLRSRRQTHVSLWEFVGLARENDTSHHCPELVARFGPWTDQYRTLQPPRMPSDWASVLSGLLGDIGWPGDRELDSIEYQTMKVWKELLSELARLDSVSGPVPLVDAVDILEDLASSRLFQPESSPAPVQILGELETAGLSFDRLWIMGMHDGAWPAVPAPDPFLPLRLQRRFELPRSTPARELEYYRLFTDRLLSSAPSIVVSYPEREDDSDLRVSPLFFSLPEKPAADLGLLTSSSYADQLLSIPRMETIHDHRGPPCDDEALRGGTSLFTLQAACPFRAFAESRLGASTPDEPVPGLDALDRGRLVHRILERVWERLGSHHGLQSVSEDELAYIIRINVSSEILNQLGDWAVRNPRFIKIEQARLEGIIRNWLRLETARKPFTILEQEKWQRVTVGGVEMTIRVDRVDRLENGEIVIIDYKTGSCSPSDWEGPRPDNPQLPIYAVATDDAVAGVFFGRVTAGDVRFRGLANATGIVPGRGVKVPDGETPMEDTIKAWSEALDRLGRDYRAGRAEVNPKDRNQTCRFCALPSLCRVSQGSVELEEDDA
ncbi:MAG: PD-(D/E)XK nuclease family protein [Gemmatimonadetes bacterium]|nr:PD-(D/E)XK nuclease family protein [Gemmatimonadota bacterium]